MKDVMVVSEVVIHHKARFTVAVPVSSDVEGDCLELVRKFSESLPTLELPVLTNIFPGLIDVNLLPLEEARYVNKVMGSWVSIGAGRLILTELFCAQPIPHDHDPRITYNRDEHFEQLELNMPT